MTLKNRKKAKRFLAIDLFSGCGGLSVGLKTSGFDVIAAIEIDKRAALTYKANHKTTKVFEKDIRDITGNELLKSLKLKIGELDLLAGCPPCQGFSRLGTRNKSVDATDERNDLIYDFGRLAEELRPKTLMLENVPALQKDPRFIDLCNSLKMMGYTITHDVLDVSNYGVPQRRRRLILLGSLYGSVELAKASRNKVSVRDVIEDLADSGNSGDPLHDLRSQHSPKVKSIISLIPKDGGSRSDLPDSLTLACHKRVNGFKDVYGRMSWDQVAPTITSGCTNPSKGRFLHPTKNRTISLREASLLQGFPRNYKFFADYGLQANSLMIGNALPPPFIQKHALMVRKNLLSQIKK